MNAHQEPAYAEDSGLNLPASVAARDHAILLPMFDALSHQEQDAIIQQLLAAKMQSVTS